MHAKYFLASHPYPKIDGEMIIYKPKKSDQPTKEKDDKEDKKSKKSSGKVDVIHYRDYSLRKRIETTVNKPSTGIGGGKKRVIPGKKGEPEKEKEKEAKLQCLEIDLQEPLTPEEWQNFAQVIDETKGLGWFQVLPVDQKSSMPYQFNMLHVLPQDKIPVGTVPLDGFISSQIAFLRKKERSGAASAAMITSVTAGRQLT